MASSVSTLQRNVAIRRAVVQALEKDLRLQLLSVEGIRSEKDAYEKQTSAALTNLLSNPGTFGLRDTYEMARANFDVSTEMTDKAEANYQFVKWVYDTAYADYGNALQKAADLDGPISL